MAKDDDKFGDDDQLLIFKYDFGGEAGPGLS